MTAEHKGKWTHTGNTVDTHEHDASWEAKLNTMTTEHEAVKIKQETVRSDDRTWNTRRGTREQKRETRQGH